jgi:glucose/arabinose dehydrogenase
MRYMWGIVLVLLLCAAPVRGQETDQETHWQQIADGFTFITAIVQPPDDSSRLFIVDLQGSIRIVEDGVLLPDSFLDLNSVINTETYGQGVLGMTFHPDYAQNGYFFVTYTSLDNSPTLARHTVSADDPNRANPDSALVVLVVDHASPLHNGGDVAFGRDGHLYWTVGDGGYLRSPAQSLRSHLGGILRLDVDNGTPYSIPPDNPYVNTPDALPELWAKGLRNPWRFSFDRETGDLYIADVGEAQMEEIDFQSADSHGGENYGWNLFEGTWLYNGGSDDGLTYPIVEYSHDNGNCSITGGYVYRGAALPDLVGKYVFSDYCSGMFWTTYRRDGENWYTAELMDTRFRVTTFGQDNAGELYVGDARSGAVYQLIGID